MSENSMDTSTLTLVDHTFTKSVLICLTYLD